MPPLALHHEPFLLTGRRVLHICPRDSELQVVGRPQVELTPRHHTGDIEKVAEFVKSRLPLDVVLLTLLLPEHQEPR